MACVLFGTIGCNLDCALTSDLYGYKTFGVCNQNQTCSCGSNSTNRSIYLHEVWGKKFDSDYVYDQIIKDDSLSQKAAKIFSDLMATADEYKQLLKPILSPYQYARLQTNDRSLAARFIKNGTIYNLTFGIRRLRNETLESIWQEHLTTNQLQEPGIEIDDTENLDAALHHAIVNEVIDQRDRMDVDPKFGQAYSKLKLNDRSPAAEYIKKGKVDQQSVQKFISDQLDKFSQSLLTKDYRKRFRNALRNVRDKGTIYNFAYKVARMGNKALEEVFDEYLKNSKMKKPVVKLDEEPLINEILHYLIVNEFIKRNDARKRN
ncbi:hypothetical protein U1Q18_050757 [Sarracenia purpurea var. burkii]